MPWLWLDWADLAETTALMKYPPIVLGATPRHLKE